jgi:hypothetical protein
MYNEDYKIIKFDDDIIGKTFVSRNNGKFTVIGATNILKGTHRMYLCKFLNTNSTGLFRKDKILSGEIKDRYVLSVCGVACIGNASSKSPLYPKWQKMIKRCYDMKSKDYKYYGALGITVSERWMCFENFEKDVVTIPGYDYEKMIDHEIELDKDLLGKRMYSLETTRWLPVSINKYMGNQTQISNLPYIIAVSPNNEKIRFQSMKNFATIHNLHHSAIARCVHGEQTSHKGWTFYYE